MKGHGIVRNLRSHIDQNRDRKVGDGQLREWERTNRHKGECMMRRRERVQSQRAPKLLFCVASLALGIACQGQPAPLTAQVGSTIVVPLSGGFTSTVFGYGGTEVIDYQRGEMRFRLDGPTGSILTTRGTSRVSAGHSSPLGRGFGFAPSSIQVVSVVEIPADDDLVGPHLLHVSRVRIENSAEVEYTYPAGTFGPMSLSILPSEVTFPLPGGGSATVTGAATPFVGWIAGIAYTDITSAIPAVVPDPEIEVQFDTPLSALEITVNYPDDVIDVVGVLEPPQTYVGNLAKVWYEESTPGTLVIKSVAGGRQFAVLSIVFTLDDGATEILDPDDVAIAVDKAFDDDGSPVAGVDVLTKVIR